MANLEVKNLHVSIDGKEILKGISYKFQTGKIYAIIGPNGNGKSTLLSTIMGDPNFEIKKGDILLNGKSIKNDEPDERSRKGVYLCMQYPSDVEGVSNISLMKSALDKRSDKPISQLSLHVEATAVARQIRFNGELLERQVNVGFSGGEQKKNELLQMFMYKPTFSFLDEVDSGLDVDSIKSVSELIEKQKNNDQSFIIVSHYQKLYETVKPDTVLVIKDGKIAHVGNYDFLMKTLEDGFDE